MLAKIRIFVKTERYISIYFVKTERKARYISDKTERKARHISDKTERYYTKPLYEIFFRTLFHSLIRFLSVIIQQLFYIGFLI